MIPAWFLPDGMTDIVFLVLVATSFAASLITVAFGIGGGGVLLAVMAILVPPAALIPTHGVIQIGSNLGRALITFGRIFWPAIPAFAAAWMARSPDSPGAGYSQCGSERAPSIEKRGKPRCQALRTLGPDHGGASSQEKARQQKSRLATL